MITIGIMSGTSCDGADAIALRLDSVSEPHEPHVLAHAHEPYPPHIREALLTPETLRAPQIAELHYALPEIYARAAQRLGCLDKAEVCGAHGQTLWHAPPSKNPAVAATLQIGSSAVLAHRLGVPVVGDLRGADIAEGGEGAPIVPYTHWFFTPPEARPRLIVNFGGIANVTLVGSTADDVVGYDVGPGMMISDAFAARTSLGKLDCDRDGTISRGGTPIDALVKAIVDHPFVSAKPPKSTGREDFGSHFFEPLLARFANQRTADVALSLLLGSARCVALSVERAGFVPREIVLTGGGARNPTLARLVAELIPSAAVRVADSGVLVPDHHEPAAVALIAARTFAQLPSSLPRVTGARRAARLGHIHWP